MTITPTGLVFGRRCPGCESPISAFAPADFCRECRDSVHEMTDRDFCGEYVNHIKAEYEYTGPVRKGLVRFKFSGSVLTGDFFARRMAELVEATPEFSSCDMILYIPGNENSVCRANQSRRLAKTVARLTGIPMADGVMKKLKGVRSQLSCRTMDERRKNIRDAFRVTDKKAVCGRKILLIDDICTTGATLDAAAVKLLSAGAAEIYACVAAKTVTGKKYAAITFNPDNEPTIFHTKKKLF